MQIASMLAHESILIGLSASSREAAVAQLIAAAARVRSVDEERATRDVATRERLASIRLLKEGTDYDRDCGDGGKPRSGSGTHAASNRPSRADGAGCVRGVRRNARRGVEPARHRGADGLRGPGRRSRRATGSRSRFGGATDPGTRRPRAGAFVLWPNTGRSHLLRFRGQGTADGYRRGAGVAAGAALGSGGRHACHVARGARGEELLYYRIFREHFGRARSLAWMGRTKVPTTPTAS